MSLANRTFITGLLALAACSGCGERAGENIPDEATLYVDRTTLTFPTLYVGTSRQENVIIKNKGSKELTISKATLDGNANGQLSTPTLSTQTLKYNATAFIQVTYTPSGPGDVSANLTIESNAPANGTVKLPVSGKAITQ